MELKLSLDSSRNIFDILLFSLSISQIKYSSLSFIHYLLHDYNTQEEDVNYNASTLTNLLACPLFIIYCNFILFIINDILESYHIHDPCTIYKIRLSHLVENFLGSWCISLNFVFMIYLIRLIP